MDPSPVIYVEEVVVVEGALESPVVSVDTKSNIGGNCFANNLKHDVFLNIRRRNTDKYQCKAGRVFKNT